VPLPPLVEFCQVGASVFEDPAEGDGQHGAHDQRREVKDAHEDGREVISRIIFRTDLRIKIKLSKYKFMNVVFRGLMCCHNLGRK
jgi:hypothetical protein